MFKDIKGYEGLYAISEDGKIINIINNKERKTHIDKCGYERIVLIKNNIKKNYCVHRLVAQAYLDDYSETLQVNHKDEVKTNNHYSNLEMCTAKYNNNYGTRNERISKKIKGVINVGKHNSPATEFKKGQTSWIKGKPNYWSAKKIRCVETGEVFVSLVEAGRNKRIPSQNIVRAAKSDGKWTAAGYHWEYAND